MTDSGIRWQQRFSNFQKAFAQLDSAVQLMRERELSSLEKQGLIQAFEFSYELAWNCLRDYLVWQGIEGIVGSRDTIREAFSKGLVEDGDTWMKMLLDRNRTSHTYNEKIAEEILSSIEKSYLTALQSLSAKLRALAAK